MHVVQHNTRTEKRNKYYKWRWWICRVELSKIKSFHQISERIKSRKTVSEMKRQDVSNVEEMNYFHTKRASRKSLYDMTLEDKSLSTFLY